MRVCNNFFFQHAVKASKREQKKREEIKTNVKVKNKNKENVKITFIQMSNEESEVRAKNIKKVC